MQVQTFVYSCNANRVCVMSVTAKIRFKYNPIVTIYVCVHRVNGRAKVYIIFEITPPQVLKLVNSLTFNKITVQFLQFTLIRSNFVEYADKP